MPKPVMQVEGARELRRTMKAAGEDLSDLKETHLRVASQVVPVARTLAPKRSGRLANSIRPGGTKTAAVIKAGGKAVPYANPIHWGWGRRHIAANPWMARAAKQTEPTWTATYTASVELILGRVKGKI
jgi:hypothetical protein